MHALPSLHAVPLVFATAAGQPVAGTHAPIVWHWSVVHVTVVPPPHVPAWHVSPVVHALASLQAVPFVFGEQVPTRLGRLQAEHWLVQAVSQHTPFTQNPVEH